MNGKGPEPTYSPDGNFAASEGVTRIDGILLNAWAAKLFHRFWCTGRGGLLHKQLHVQLRADLYNAPITVVRPPAAYTLEGRIEMAGAEEVQPVALQTMENMEELVVCLAVEEEVGVYKPLDKLQIMLAVQEAMVK